MFGSDRRAVFLALAVFPASGCAGGASAGAPAAPVVSEPLGAQRTAGALSRAAQKTIDAGGGAAIIVSDQVASDVGVYAASGTLIATIGGFSSPGGLAIGAASNRYIADFQRHAVDVYKSDNVTLLSTLADPGYDPLSVAYDGGSGTVAAVNQLGTGNRQPGSVRFYARGATTPCATVTDPHWTQFYFAAFDGAGKLYVDGVDFTRPLIGVIAGGCSATGVTTLHFANAIGLPGGIGITPAGRIAVLDQTAKTIDTYDAPAGSALGEPVAVTALSGVSEISTFAFTQSGAQLWTADASGHAALKFAYPAGGNPVARIATGASSQPYGIAAIPPERP
jgi:hypothetical protein